MPCPGAPANADTLALSKRGYDLMQAGNTMGSLDCHEMATTRSDATPYTWYHRGYAEAQFKMDEACRKSYARAIKVTSKSKRLEDAALSEAYFQLGRVAKDVDNNLEQAEKFYLKAIHFQPKAAGAHVMLAVALREADRVEESVKRYIDGLRIQPGIPGAQYNLATNLLTLGRPDEALRRFQLAVAAAPTMTIAHKTYGDELHNQNRYDEAIAAFDALEKIEPKSAVPHFSRGKAYFMSRRLNQAIQAHERALELPVAPEAPRAYIHNDLGNAKSDKTGRPAEVLFHYQTAARLMPSFAEALSNVGTAYKERGRNDEAAYAFQRAIRAKPVLCEAYKNLGSSYGEIDGRLPEATSAFEGALRINPQFWPALYSLLDTKQFLSHWKSRENLLHQLTKHLSSLHRKGGSVEGGPDERMHSGLAPFQTLVLPLGVRSQLAITRHRAKKDVEMAQAMLPLTPPLPWPLRAANAKGASSNASAAVYAVAEMHGALRIALLSSDFGDHPVGHAMPHWIRALGRVLGQHVLCFASDSIEKHHEGSEMRREIAALCDTFYDITDLSDEDAARVISEAHPHVLINLVGHTAGARHVLTHLQASPVQAMHYGYPATTGIPRMGYMQLDRICAPPLLRRDYTEKLAYFPHSHFVAVHAERYPHTARSAMSAHPWHAREAGGMGRIVRFGSGEEVRRADLGLGRYGSRDETFALCNFNQLYKMEPETLAVWTNALRRHHSAFLWLTRVSVRKDTSLYAQTNVIDEAASHGTSSERLTFTSRLPQRDYLPIRALADLMVDNTLYNAHTTGADTLYAGVPSVLTSARVLSGRAGASFATALGGSDMIVHSLKHYEDVIDTLAKRPRRLWHMRRKLVASVERAPFYDLSRLASGQHRLATSMWRVYAAGYKPMHIIAAR